MIMIKSKSKIRPMNRSNSNSTVSVVIGKKKLIEKAASKSLDADNLLELNNNNDIDIFCDNICQNESMITTENSDRKKTSVSETCDKKSANKTFRIDSKSFNHCLKDIGIDTGTIKRLNTIINKLNLDPKDLLQTITLNQFQTLFDGQCLNQFLDYLETIDICTFKSTKQNSTLKNKITKNANKDENENLILLLINKWRNEKTSGKEMIKNNNHQPLNNAINNKNRIINFMPPNAIEHRPGPDSRKLLELLEKNDYIVELSKGQRKYRMSPTNLYNEQTETTELNLLPGNTEIFVGKIPKDMFEDELVPLFENIGKIYILRLMMDPMTGLSRGYAFITYFKPEHAQLAVEKFDNYELANYGAQLKVKMSIPNVRLFIGNISKEMTKEDILDEFSKYTPGLVDAIVYYSPHDRKLNRGFCFLEYESHKYASQAKRKLMLFRKKIRDSDIWVDWAEPLEQPNEEIMSQVKVLYVRNLALEMNDQHIQDIFKKYGPIIRVKKIRDYAFIHFEERESALKAMKQMNGQIIDPNGVELEISLAKPPTDRRRKEEILRNREKRLMHTRLFDNVGIYKNRNQNMQTIAIVPQQSIYYDNSRITATPILLNSPIDIPSSATANIATITPQISMVNFPLNNTVCAPNCFLGYTLHYPIYQIPIRSPVARVTLNDSLQIDDYEKNEMTKLDDGDFLNSNYCQYENCTWCTSQTLSSLFTINTVTDTNNHQHYYYNYFKTNNEINNQSAEQIDFRHTNELAGKNDQPISTSSLSLSSIANDNNITTVISDTLANDNNTTNQKCQ